MHEYAHEPVNMETAEAKEEIVFWIELSGYINPRKEKE